jgi:2'-5' RNA ligase
MAGAWDEVDYYSVGIFPSLPEEPIASFRRHHDPTVDLVAPHLTLVFPVAVQIGGRAFGEHVRRVASATRPFDIHLTGLEKSWDHWLFLLVAEGRVEALALHDALYSGILAPHLREDLPYEPHVGLGFFAEHEDAHDLLEVRSRRVDRARFDSALREAEAMELDYTVRVEEVVVVGLDEEATRLTMLERLQLRSA